MRIIVTGTDTDVGKTVLSAAILRWLQPAKVNYFKPIQTGALNVDGRWEAGDILTVNQLADTAFSTEKNCSYVLKEPMSPFQAATKERLNIDILKIFEELEVVENDGDHVVIEGAGGLYVPITSGDMMIDLFEALGGVVIVAVKPGLGTINHSILTINTLLARGIDVIGFVVCDSPQEEDSIAQENPRMIERFSGIPCLGKIYHQNTPVLLKEHLCDDLSLDDL
jgi:dethiobiotin synthetase